jgi:hypothetical protein
VEKEPNEWKELDFLKWVNEKIGEELFRVNVSLEDRKERWHCRFKKLLDETISRCKSFIEVDSDQKPFFITALKSAT